MQVRIDRNQPIEMLLQQLGKQPGRERLAGMENTVLTHIGEIRGDKSHARCAELPAIAAAVKQSGTNCESGLASVQTTNTSLSFTSDCMQT